MRRLVNYLSTNLDSASDCAGDRGTTFCRHAGRSHELAWEYSTAVQTHGTVPIDAFTLLDAFWPRKPYMRSLVTLAGLMMWDE